jgi:hypothetical protein
MISPNKQLQRISSTDCQAKRKIRMCEKNYRYTSGKLSIWKTMSQNLKEETKDEFITTAQ